MLFSCIIFGFCYLRPSGKRQREPIIASLGFLQGPPPLTCCAPITALQGTSNSPFLGVSWLPSVTGMLGLPQRVGPNGRKGEGKVPEAQAGYPDEQGRTVCLVKGSFPWRCLCQFLDPSRWGQGSAGSSYEEWIWGLHDLTRAVWGQRGDPGHPSLWLCREVRAWGAGSPAASQRPSVPLLLPSRGHGHCLRARRPCHLHGMLFFLGLCLVASIPCGCQPGVACPWAFTPSLKSLPCLVVMHRSPRIP